MPRIVFADPLTSLSLPASFVATSSGTASATPTASGMRLRTAAASSSINVSLGLGPILNGEVAWQVTFATLASFNALYHVVNCRQNALQTHDVDVEIDITTAGSGACYLFDDAQATQLATSGTPTLSNSQTFGFKFIFIGYMGILKVWNITGGQDETSGVVISAEGLTWQTAGDINFGLGSDPSGTGTQDILVHDMTITEYLGPYPVALRGTLANVVSGTNAVALTNPTLIAPGNMLLTVMAVDNSGTNGAAPPLTSITDPRSNVHTIIDLGLADPGVASAGSKCYAATAPVVTAYQAGDSITPVFTANPPAKAVRVYEIAQANLRNAAAPVTSSGATTTVTTGPATVLRSDSLAVGVTAAEAPDADTITWDTDAVDGAWARMTALGTTDATATNNQKVWLQLKAIYTYGTPASQTLNQVLGTTRDWAGGLFIITAPVVLKTAVMVNQAIRRASVF